MDAVGALRADAGVDGTGPPGYTGGPMARDALVGMAQASGLMRVAEGERDAWRPRRGGRAS
jgi:hypothetical protein